MELAINLMFAIERCAQWLPERSKFMLSFCAGFIAYLCNCDAVFDFWDFAIATAPSGVPSALSISRKEVVILASTSHIFTVIFEFVRDDIFDVLRLFI